MKIVIDSDKCTGHGVCEMIAEDVFEVSDDDGVAKLLTDTVDDGRRAQMDDAVAQCPTQAISIES